MDKDTFIDEIAELIVNQPEKVVFWVGAGLSFKTYGDVFRRIKLDLTGDSYFADTDHPDYLKIIEDLRREDPKKYNEVIHELFSISGLNRSNIDESNYSLKELVDSDGIPIVTTNFDPILQFVIKPESKKKFTYPKNNLPYCVESRGLYYIHGDYEIPANMFFTDDVLQEIYNPEKNNLLQLFLLNLFLYKNVVFVGTSFDDDCLRKHLLLKVQNIVTNERNFAIDHTQYKFSPLNHFCFFHDSGKLKPEQLEKRNKTQQLLKDQFYFKITNGITSEFFKDLAQRIRLLKDEAGKNFKSIELPNTSVEKIRSVKKIINQEATVEIFDELTKIINGNETLSLYFYSKISYFPWLKVFKIKQVFTQEKLDSNGFWQPLLYLCNLFQTHPNDVLKIIESDFPETLSHQSILYTLGIIKKHLSQVQKITEDSKIVKWLKNLDFGDKINHTYGYGVVEAYVELMKGLSDAKRFDEEYVLFKTLFAKHDSFSTENYDYKQGLEEIYKDKSFCVNQPVFESLCEWAEQELIRSQDLKEADKPHDRYYHSFGSYDHYSKLQQVLVRAVLQVGKIKIENDPQSIDAILKVLSAYDWNLFESIQLWLLKEFSNKVDLSLISQKLVSLKERVERKSGVLLENYQKLLKKVYSDLDPVLQEELKNIYNLNQQERERQAGIITHRPKVFDDAKLDLITFVDKLLIWEPLAKNWEFPNFESWSGAADSLQKKILEFPDDLYVCLKKFNVNFEPAYRYAIFSAWHEILKKNQTLFWQEILNFAESTLNNEEKFIEAMRPREAHADDFRYAYQADLKDTKKAILRLLDQAMTSEENSKSPQFKNHADQIWKILNQIATDKDPTPEREQQFSDHDREDYYDVAINSVRASAVESIIQYALWQFNAFDQKQMSGEIKNKLEWHLSIANEPSFAVRSVFGHWLPWLIKIDESWVRANLSRIFPEDVKNHNYRKAVWETYLKYCGAYNRIYDVIGSEYDYWINKLDSSLKVQRSDDNLAHHLAIYYGRGILTLQKLKIFFNNASPAMRGNVLFFIGRACKYEKDDLQKPDSKKTLKLFKDLFEERVNDPKSEASEFEYFDMWIKSELFDSNWYLDQLDALVTKKGFYPAGISSKEFWSVSLGLAKKSDELSLKFLQILGKIVVSEAFRNDFYHIWEESIFEFMNSLDPKFFSTQKEAVTSIIEIVMSLVGAGKLDKWDELYEKWVTNQ